MCVVAQVLCCLLMLPGSGNSVDPRQDLSIAETTKTDESVRDLKEVDKTESVAADSEQVVTQPAGPAPTPRHTGIKAMVKDLAIDFTHLPSRENLFWVGVGGGLALAVHPADERVNRTMVNSDFAHDFFKFGGYLGEVYTLLPVAVTVYAVGRGK